MKQRMRWTCKNMQSEKRSKLRIHDFWVSHTPKAFELCLNVYIFALFVLYLQIWRGTSESQYVGVFWEFDILG